MQLPPGCYTGKAAPGCCAEISGEIWDSCNTNTCNSALLQSQLATWTGAAFVFTCAHSLQFQFWLVDSYILFRLDHCNSPLTGYPQTVIKPLRQVQNSAAKLNLKGPVKAVSGHEITPNRFKTTYRSVLTFEEKKQSITHLFKTFFRPRLGCNAFILAKRSENTVNWTFQNQRHSEGEIPQELF